MSSEAVAIEISEETLAALNSVRLRAHQFGMSHEAAVRQAISMYLEPVIPARPEPRESRPA